VRTAPGSVPVFATLATRPAIPADLRRPPGMTEQPEMKKRRASNRQPGAHTGDTSPAGVRRPASRGCAAWQGQLGGTSAERQVAAYRQRGLRDCAVLSLRHLSKGPPGNDPSGPLLIRRLAILRGVRRVGAGGRIINTLALIRGSSWAWRSLDCDTGASNTRPSADILSRTSKRPPSPTALCPRRRLGTLVRQQPAHLLRLIAPVISISSSFF
jgi:hypothetical protein